MDGTGSPSCSAQLAGHSNLRFLPVFTPLISAPPHASPDDSNHVHTSPRCHGRVGVAFGSLYGETSTRNQHRRGMPCPEHGVVGGDVAVRSATPGVRTRANGQDPTEQSGRPLAPGSRGALSLCALSLSRTSISAHKRRRPKEPFLASSIHAKRVRGRNESTSTNFLTSPITLLYLLAMNHDV